MMRPFVTDFLAYFIKVDAMLTSYFSMLKTMLFPNFHGFSMLFPYGFSVSFRKALQFEGQAMRHQATTSLIDGLGESMADQSKLLYDYFATSFEHFAGEKLRKRSGKSGRIFQEIFYASNMKNFLH